MDNKGVDIKYESIIALVIFIPISFLVNYFQLSSLTLYKRNLGIFSVLRFNNRN